MNAIDMTRFEIRALEKEVSDARLQNLPSPDPEHWVQTYRAQRAERINLSRRVKTSQN